MPSNEALTTPQADLVRRLRDGPYVQDGASTLLTMRQAADEIEAAAAATEPLRARALRLERLLRHAGLLMASWQEWYGEADTQFGGELPAPPSGQVRWAEFVAEALHVETPT